MTASHSTTLRSTILRSAKNPKKTANTYTINNIDLAYKQIYEFVALNSQRHRRSSNRIHFQNHLYNHILYREILRNIIQFIIIFPVSQVRVFYIGGDEVAVYKSEYGNAYHVHKDHSSRW